MKFQVKFSAERNPMPKYILGIGLIICWFVLLVVNALQTEIRPITVLDLAEVLLLVTVEILFYKTLVLKYPIQTACFFLVIAALKWYLHMHNYKSYIVLGSGLIFGAVAIYANKKSQASTRGK